MPIIVYSLRRFTGMPRRLHRNTYSDVSGMVTPIGRNLQSIVSYTYLIAETLFLLYVIYFQKPKEHCNSSGLIRNILFFQFLSSILRLTIFSLLRHSAVPQWLFPELRKAEECLPVPAVLFHTPIWKLFRPQRLLSPPVPVESYSAVAFQSG